MSALRAAIRCTARFSLLALLSLAGCGETATPSDVGPLACVSDRDCSAMGLVCDRSTGFCAECAASTDCEAGEACRGGACEPVTPCTSSRMCPGLVCDTTLGYCVECVVDLDCTEPDVCRGGDCVAPPRPCESDRDCTDIGLVCGTSVGHCVECVSDVDCPAERYCDGALVCAPDLCADGETTCTSATEIATCVANGSGFGAPASCGAGMSCVTRACVPDVDGGVPDAGEGDAGSEDAGAEDAGGLDAGSDAGGLDAGALDGGGLDAGSDAGSDGGGLDAGPTVPGAPRPLSPSSGSISTSRRPTFRWQLAPSTDGARVEVCSDRACVTVITAFDVTGSSGTPGADLPSGVVFWRLFGRAGGSTGAVPSATWQVVIGRRSAPVATTWGAPLDANGDGYGDLVIGAPGARTASVYFGSPTAIGASAALTLSRPAADDGSFGATVASLADVNGDGFGDLAVSAPNYAGGIGRVYVFLGTPTGPSGTASRVLTGTDGASGLFGTAIAGADLDRDGYADLVVGAPGAATRTGRLHVFAGGPTGPSATATRTLSPPDTGEIQFGSALASLGDLDGDGYSDLVVGARFAGASGRAYVYRGGASGVVTTPTWPLDAPAGGDFGYSVSSAGDVDGDGFVDLVVGAYQASGGEGRAYVYRGSASGPIASPATLRGGTGMAYFGSAVAGVGDVNGDGYDDVLVGAFGVGQAFAFGGGTGGVGTTPMDTLTGEGGSFGFALAALGDVDRDGYPDVCVAGYQWTAETGRAYVYRGRAGSLVTMRTLQGTTNSQFGFSLALADSLACEAADG